MDIEVEASCRCFILCLSSLFLDGHFAQAFLGAIQGFEKNLARVRLDLGVLEDFWDFWKGLEGRRGCRRHTMCRHIGLFDFKSL